MKQFKYLTSIFSLLLATAISGCSEKEYFVEDSERGIAIESISVALEGMDSSAEASTRTTTETTFSVNTNSDPTKTDLATRGSNEWKMDFSLYNGDNSTPYNGGSFTRGSYSNGSWTPVTQHYFPNYKEPKAEVYLYPNEWTMANSTPADNQSTRELLLAQDVLFKAKGTIPVAHKVNIELQHKHAMLNFMIEDVTVSEISKVTVEVGNQTYAPYNVATTDNSAGKKEYMLILPEGTKENPVVIIETINGENSDKIIYRQTINVTTNGTKELGSNQCYCFTLQGAELKISPVTVISWTTGASLPGEYIAVTAYPTFKAASHANQIYYFYYDNNLMEEDGTPKLQKITLNQDGECTIKPDGRVLTHIFKDANKTPDKSNELSPAVILGKMVINLEEEEGAKKAL